jgi:serine phosphatase RsbU (regulator of sigma subunit)
MGRPTIAIDDLLKQMLEAAKIVLKSQWKQVKPMAELQLRSTLINLELIAELKLRGKITKEQAALHIEIQKQSIRTTLLSFEGIGIVAAEKALNAALGAARTVINKSIGWKII